MGFEMGMLRGTSYEHNCFITICCFTLQFMFGFLPDFLSKTLSCNLFMYLKCEYSTHKYGRLLYSYCWNKEADEQISVSALHSVLFEAWLARREILCLRISPFLSTLTWKLFHKRAWNYLSYTHRVIYCKRPVFKSNVFEIKRCYNIITMKFSSLEFSLHSLFILTQCQDWICLRRDRKMRISCHLYNERMCVANRKWKCFPSPLSQAKIWPSSTNCGPCKSCRTKKGKYLSAIKWRSVLRSWNNFNSL
jgi:hypothetical protein